MKIINALKSRGHYPSGVITGNLLFTSGQSSVNPDTHKLEAKNAYEEAWVCLNRIDAILTKAGIDRTHVVQAKVFMTDMAMWDDFNKAFAEYFGSHTPARAVYTEPATHHGGHMEVEVIAEMVKE